MGESLLKPLRIGELTAPVPVIQGGMGVAVSLSGLAGAVAACGGVGIISTAQIGYRDKDFDMDPIGCNLRAIKEEVRKAKELSGGGIVGVNIMVATRDYGKYVRAAVQAGADLIISGAGLPMTLPELVAQAAGPEKVTAAGQETITDIGPKAMAVANQEKVTAADHEIITASGREASAGAAPASVLQSAKRPKLAPIVSSLKSAQVIMKYWLRKYGCLPDLVVIEGPLAGGHLGFAKEELLRLENMDYDKEIRRIIDHVNECGAAHGKEIPVVVAGGIYERQDAERCFMLGASGVQMATRFVTTYECDAPQVYKEAYIKAKKEDIVIVDSPVGMPGRAILNAFLKRAKQGRIPHERCHTCIAACKPQETPYCITDALVNAVKGNLDDALLFCGTNAYRAEKLERVKDIMEEFRP